MTDHDNEVEDANPDVEQEAEEVPAEEEDTPLSEDAEEEEFAQSRFNISSYGWDSDVEGLVKRINRNDIYVPGFQRGFVWTNAEKSRFIESLIMGLPVPNVFLAQDSKTRNLNIVDGQQRLLSLRDFLGGKFYLSGRGIDESLKGCYFSREVAKSKSSKVLSDADARALSDAVIHSIVIKPDPVNDDPKLGHEYNQAIIQIFKRLNTSGKPLQAQEIRASIYYGSLDKLIRELNKDENWRHLFGPKHSRMRDMELILRFIALDDSATEYKAPMPRFLDYYMEDNRDLDEVRIDEIRDKFSRVVDAIASVIGRDGLRRSTTFMITKFDAVAVGISEYYRKYGAIDADEIQKRITALEHNKDYIWSIDEFVNDTDRVQKRIAAAKEIFGA